MKRFLLAAFLLFMTAGVFAQDLNMIRGSNTYIGLYAGAGCTSRYNYNVSPSAGLFFEKGIGSRTGIGFNLFYQTFNMRYDNEQNLAKGGSGIEGVILKHSSSYVFFTPQITWGLGRRQIVNLYVTAGVGMKIGGYDTLRKWNHTYNDPGVSYYDSTLDMSKNLNSMLLRVGIGFREFLAMGKHWRFTFTEDLGFLSNSVTKTTDTNNPSRTELYWPGKLNPCMISLQIGICHTKYR